jgi:hypothetical protein
MAGAVVAQQRQRDYGDGPKLEEESVFDAEAGAGQYVITIAASAKGDGSDLKPVDEWILAIAPAKRRWRHRRLSDPRVLFQRSVSQSARWRGPLVHPAIREIAGVRDLTPRRRPVRDQ